MAAKKKAPPTASAIEPYTWLSMFMPNTILVGIDMAKERNTEPIPNTIAFTNLFVGSG